MDPISKEIINCVDQRTGIFININVKVDSIEAEVQKRKRNVYVIEINEGQTDFIQDNYIGDKIVNVTVITGKDKSISNQRQEMQNYVEEILTQEQHQRVNVEKYFDIDYDVIVEKLIEKFIEKEIEIEQINERQIQKIIEIPVEAVGERPVERIVEKPVEYVRYVDVEYEKIVEIPVETIVERPV